MLLLDVAAGSPAINVTQSGRILTIDSVIGGNDGLTKSGAGALTLSGVNTYSGTTTISAGEVVATTGSTFTPFGGGAVDIGANVLTLSPSSTAANSTLANTLTGTGILNINPAAERNMVLSGTLSGFSGTVNVAANTGSAKLATGSVTLGSGAIVNIASGATWFMSGGTHSGITANINGTGNSENLGALRMDGGTISNTSSVVLKADGSVGANSGTGTINAVISDGGKGYSFTKMGAGTLALGAVNTYSGATIISKGTLLLANASALDSTSGITIAGGAVLTTNLNGVSLGAPITLGASGTTATINAPALGTTGGTVYTLTLNGAISGAGNLTLRGVQGGNVYGTIILNAASDYTGSTLFTTDANNSNKNIFVRLGVANALPTTTVLTLDGQNGTGTAPGRQCQLDLYGFDQTLAGLTNVARDLRVQRVVNSAGTAATLTINDSGSRTYSGLLGRNGSDNFGLTKLGSGTWTVSGVNTYTGATTVGAGTLALNYATNNSSKLSDTAALILRRRRPRPWRRQPHGNRRLDHTRRRHGFPRDAFLGHVRAADGLYHAQRGLRRRLRGRIHRHHQHTNTNGILLGATINGADWATNSTDGPNGVITKYTGYTDVTRLDGGSQVIADGPATNVRIVEGFFGSPANITLGAATTTINTLNQSASGGTGAATIDPAGQTLRTNAILVGAGAGALTVGTGTNNGTLAAAVPGGELALANNTPGRLTVNSGIADNSGSSLTVYAGMVALTGTNSYTGATTVTIGTTLLAAKPAALYNDGGSMANWTKENIVVNAGGTLAVNYGGGTDLNQTQVAAVLSNLTTSINNNGLKAGSTFGFDTTNAGGSATYGLAIADSTGTGGGALGLIKLGEGTLTLSAANTYSGPTIINAGTLAISGSGTLGSGFVLTLGGGKLDLGTTSQTVGAVSITAAAASGDTVSNGNLTGTSYAASNSTGNAIISANLLVNGTAGFTKTGAGTVTLSGTNTYTGATTVDAGNTLVMGNPQALGLSTANVVLNGWTLDIATAGSDNPYNFTINSNNISTIVSNVASGTAGIDHTMGSINIGGSTSAGGTQLNITAGAGITSGTPTITFGAVTLGSGTTGVTTTFNPTTASLIIGSVTTGSTTSGTKTLNLDGTATGNQITGAISNGTGTNVLAVAKTNTGTWTFSGGNTYTGATNVTDGTLTLDAASVFNPATAAGIFTVNGASAVANINGTYNSPDGNGTAFFVIQGGGVLNFSGNATLTTVASGAGMRIGDASAGTMNMTGGSLTYTAINGSNFVVGRTLGGNGILNVTGGTLTATGPGGFVIANDPSTTGTVTVGGTGTLAVGTATVKIGGDASATGAEFNLNTGGTFILGTSPTSAGTNNIFNFDGGMLKSSAAITMSGLTRANVRDGGAKFDTTGGTITIAQALEHSNIGGDNAIDGGLTKAGAGTLTLSGANTYTGGTIVNAGVLIYSNQAAKPASGITSAAAQTTLGLGVKSGDTSFFDVSDVDSLFAGSMTNVTNSPLSNVGIDTTGGDFVYGSSVSSNTRGLHKLGPNILTLSGNNAYTGTTYVTAGTLKLAPSSGSALPATAAVQNNGTLEIAATGQTVGAIGGTGTTLVNATASLIADSIVQDTLTIGAGGSVTIREAAGGAGNAVPEPSTFVLLAMSAIGLLAFAWRRRKRVA